MKELARFQYEHSPDSVGHMIVPVKVNGKGPYPFILDTGASHMCVGHDLAETLGLIGEKAEALGAGGQFCARSSILRSVGIKRAYRRGLTVAIIDLTQISASLSRDIYGVVGYDFLRKFKLFVDYPKKEVILYL